MDQHIEDRTIAGSSGDMSTGYFGRRAVLRAGAAVPVGVGLATVAACGSEESSGGAEAAGSDAGENTDKSASGDAAAPAQGFPTADVPVGGATYDKASKTVYSQPTEGDFRAFDSRCPHQGCAVSDFSDGQMSCPCHGSTFDPGTGEVTAGPATSGLTPREVTVDGTDLVLG